MQQGERAATKGAGVGQPAKYWGKGLHFIIVLYSQQVKLAPTITKANALGIKCKHHIATCPHRTLLGSSLYLTTVPRSQDSKEVVLMDPSKCDSKLNARDCHGCQPVWI